MTGTNGHRPSVTLVDLRVLRDVAARVALAHDAVSRGDSPRGRTILRALGDELHHLLAPAGEPQ